MADKLKAINLKTKDKFMNTKILPHSATSTDDNSISPQVSALEALIYDYQENHQAKIKFIQEELSAGNYQINPTQIAAKLSTYIPNRSQEKEISDNMLATTQNVFASVSEAI